MKKFALFLVIAAGITACKTQTAAHKTPTAYKPYQVSYDEKSRKVLTGLISRADIESDTAFGWFKKNYNMGRPDAGAVASFKQHAGNFKVLIFAGTWCPDTQNLLPEFYRLTDAAGYADSNISVIGVDHSKKTLDNLSTTFHVVDVPTFIILKDGKEAGRVVEYGESGEAMKELGKIAEGL